MGRPRKTRFITNEPGTRVLIPADAANKGDTADCDSDERVILTYGEYEAMRLVDYEGLYQDAAGEMLGVSRQTVGRILTEGRRKVISTLVEGRALEIEGGDIEMMVHYECSDCKNEWLMFQGMEPSKHCPSCGGQNISGKQWDDDQSCRFGGRRRKWSMGGGRGRDGRSGRRGMGRGGKGEGGQRGSGRGGQNGGRRNKGNR